MPGICGIPGGSSSLSLREIAHSKTSVYATRQQRWFVPSPIQKIVFRKVDAFGGAVVLWLLQKTSSIGVPSFGHSDKMRAAMEFSEAVRRANQILDQEGKEPTARYYLGSSAEGPTWPLSPRSPLTERDRMELLWKFQAEKVFKDPCAFEFTSDNYKMLVALNGMLVPKDREALASVLLGKRMNDPPGCRLPPNLIVGQPPRWDDLVSELPLLAEFCLRSGAKSVFFRALAEATPMPGHAVLLRHLEDTIRFNPALFSEDDYKNIALSVSTLAATVQSWQGKGDGWEVTSKRTRWTIWSEDARREFTDLSDNIQEACEKVTFLHLKYSFLSGLNLEVNQDKQTVESYLQRLGFSQTLRDSLNEAEQLYRARGDGFSLKSCMGHLRSFLENLHKEKMQLLHAKYGGTPPSGWGDGLTYLRKNKVISAPEEKFAAGLYILISDQAVHPLMAEQEYARLARNMVIEYGLLFLRKIEKAGNPPAPSA